MDQAIVVHPNIMIEKMTHGVLKNDGIQIAKCLSLEHEIPNVWDFKNFDIKVKLSGHESVLFENMVHSHIVIVNEILKNDADYGMVLDLQCQKFSDLMTVISINNNQKELAPCVRMFVSDLRKISMIVDQHKNERGTIDYTTTERLIDYLMTTIRSPTFGPNFMSPGSLAMANQMFQAYYCMNKYNLAMSLIKTFEQNPNYSAAILEDLVHYKFLVGRYHLLVQDYKNSYLNLKFSFDNCPTSMKKNKRLILLYLIPTMLKLGVMPNKNVHKFIEENHPIFDIIKSLRDGDLNLFKNTLNSSKEEFVRLKIFFIIYELKKMVIRTLYHKTFLYIKDRYPRFQIPILIFQNIRGFFSSKKTEADFDKVCCELAILVFEGYIKGYISLAHKKIVFFIDNPFPSTQSVTYSRFEIDQ